MAQFIVDSGALLAMLDRRDKYHSRAASFVHEHGEVEFYLPELVFSETMTLVKARLGAVAAIELGERIQKSSKFQVTKLNKSTRERTWEIFKRYSDKDWSYADCAILAVAREEGISQVFSFDHHMSQMEELRRAPS